MEEVFSYIIGLGAAVMMPIIYTILGVCIGIKLSKALKSGLLVGVGFVGLSVVTALLTSSLGPAFCFVVDFYPGRPDGRHYRQNLSAVCRYHCDRGCLFGL